MLKLNRYIGESIKIGDDTTVVVLGIEDGVVHIGIDAPRDIGVHREEVYRRIQAERAQKSPIPQNLGNSFSNANQAPGNGFPDVNQAKIVDLRPARSSRHRYPPSVKRSDPQG